MKTAELCRLPIDGTYNACSQLYAAAAKVAAKDWAFEKIQTFILESEPGTSLKATGWTFDGMTKGDSRFGLRKGRRRDVPEGRKQRWIKVLR